MKILFVTHKWQAKTGESCVRALRQLGHETELAWGKIGAVSLTAKFYYRLKRTYWLGNKISDYEMYVLNNIIINKALKLQPDLIIVNAGGEVLPETLDVLRKKTFAKLVCWAGDNPLTYKHAPHYISGIRYYDNFFIVDPSWYNAEFKSYGVKKCSVLLYGVDPEIYHPENLTDKEKMKYSSDLCHLGSPHKERIEILTNLLDYDLSIWGATSTKIFKRFSKLPDSLLTKVRSGVVPAVVSNKIYNASKICLNIQHQQMNNTHSNKTFEITASGAFVLTSYSPSFDPYFPDGELVSFKDFRGIRNIIDYFLKNDCERKERANKAYTRTINNHLYKHRMEQLFSEVII